MLLPLFQIPSTSGQDYYSRKSSYSTAAIASVMMKSVFDISPPASQDAYMISACTTTVSCSGTSRANMARFRNCRNSSLHRSRASRKDCVAPKAQSQNFSVWAPYCPFTPASCVMMWRPIRDASTSLTTASHRRRPLVLGRHSACPRARHTVETFGCRSWAISYYHLSTATLQTMSPVRLNQNARCQYVQKDATGKVIFPYQCKYCTYSFSPRSKTSNIQRHMLAMHSYLNVEPQDEAIDTEEIFRDIMEWRLAQTSQIPFARLGYDNRTSQS